MVDTNRASDLLPQTISKVRARLLPLMVTMYIVAYIDKVNVGFAGVQMTKALSLGPTVFGLGAGIFFFGYTIFEVPSNLMLCRVGARQWMARILFTWGAFSVGMAFTRDAMSFYIIRFLLGAAEAGFLSGMMFYMTFWFPQSERARVTALFLMSTPIAVIIASPISGALLDLDGNLGLAGWQWLFIIEGVPAILLSFVAYKFLTNRPEEAKWLSAEEREVLSRKIAEEDKARLERRRFTVLQALANPRIILYGFLYFGILTGVNGLVIWLPQVVKGFQLSNVAVGFVVTIPYFVTIVAMLLWARHSDHTGERVWHVAIPTFVGGLGLVLSANSVNPVAQLLGVAIGVAGLYSAMSPFWALPTSFLTGASAAGGLAFITTIANFGGFVGPSVIGYVKEATGSYSAGIASMSAGGFLACILALTQLGRGPSRPPVQVASELGSRP